MYDAIVVGARCAGAPTAMLLARRGRRVLLLERADLPPRHALDALHPPVRRRPPRALGPAGPPRRDRLPAHPPATASTSARSRSRAPRRRSTASTPPTPRAATCSTRCSPKRPPRPARRSARAPRSTGLLTEGGRVDRACAAAAGVRRSGARVCDRRGRPQLDRGARRPAREIVEDRPARSPAPTTRTGPACRSTASSSTRAPGRMIVTSPTHDGRNVVIVLWPQAEFEAVRADIEGAFTARVALAPGLAERAARRHAAWSRFRGTRLLPNHLPQRRRPRLGARGRRRPPQGPDPRARASATRSATPTCSRRPSTAAWTATSTPSWPPTASAATSLARPGFESTIAVRRPAPAVARAAGAVRAPARRPGADRPLLRRLRGHGRPGGVLQPRRRRSSSVKRRGTAASSPSSYSVTTISSPRGRSSMQT